MSRRSIIALICLAFLAGLALVPWTLPSGRLDRQVRREIASAFGLDAALTGRATFALLPLPRVKFGEVSLTAANGTTLLSHAQLRGDLRLASLLVGRIELSDLSLSDGRLSIDVAPGGRTSWDATFSRIASRLDNPGSAVHEPKRLILTGMTVLLRDSRSSWTAQLDGANLLLRFPTEGVGLDVIGAAIWNRQTVEFTITRLDTAAVAAGNASPFDARLKSPAVDVAVAGEMTWTDKPRLTGNVTADLPSLRDALAWAGYAAAGTDRAFAATGEVAVSSDQLALSNLRATLGAERLDGALSVRLDGTRPAVTATLAGDNLDLSLFSREVKAGPADGLRPVEIADLRNVDLDLRLSASKADLGRGLAVADLATSVLTGPDKIDINLGRATFSGGQVRGRMTIGSEGNVYDLRGQTSFSRLDIAGCLATLGGGNVLSGIAQGQAVFEASASTPAALMQNLSGRLGVTIHDGEVSGLAMPETRPTETRTALAAWRAGRMAFQRLQVNLNLAEGLAEFTDATLDSSLQHVSMSGSLSLPDGALKLKARSGPPLDGAVEGSSYVWDVNGPWTRPVLSVEGAPGAHQPR